MSSSKGTSNSNKTAHVMNLLRKSNPTPPQTEAAPVSPAQAQPAPPSSQQPPAAPAAQVPPIITALNADAEVSSQIKDALSEALAEEEALAAAADQGTQAVEPVHNAHVAGPVAEVQADEADQEFPASEPFQEAQQTGADQEAQTAEAVQDTEVADLPHSPQLAGPVEDTQTVGAGSVQERQSTEADPGEPVLINIMQQLVEELADKYISLFGLCSCSRCRKDVIALTLNELHPRYVVMPMWEFKIRSDMYSNRYSSEITAQLLRACRVVMDSPRHTLPDAPTTR